MLVIYGSKLCPDCVIFKKNCDMYGIEYEFRDITESLPFMKEFLKIRDENAVFDEVKKNGSIGIPAVVTEDGKVTLDWEKVISDKGFTPFREEKTSCSLDNRSGC